MSENKKRLRSNIANAAMQPKKRFPLFRVLLLCFVIAAIAFIANVLNKITAFLEEYESVQPKYVEAEVFDTYFNRIDYDKLLKAADRGDGEISEFETREDLIAYLKGLYEGKEISCYSISTGTSDSDTAQLRLSDIAGYFVEQFNSKGDIRYIVKAGEDKIAEFTLVHSESELKKSKHGFKRYELGDIELFFFPHESVTVKLPASSTLTLNGIAVGESYLMPEVYEEDESNQYLPEGIEGIVYVAYTVDGLFFKPEIAVTDKDGKPTECIYVEDGNYWSSGFIYDAALEEQFADYVINAIEKYAAYMQMDGKQADFIDYYDTDSELWQNIITTQNYFVWEHEGYTFKDRKASEFYRYDDNVFSCRVSMTHILHRYGWEDYVDYIDMTLFLRSVNGKYVIFDSFARQ